MAWFIFGIFLYILVLLSERALVNISPHDLEQLRNDDARSARFARTLALDVRATLSALLLARIFLKVLMTVFLVSDLIHRPFIHDRLNILSEQYGWPGWLAWWLVAAVLALLLALVFWGLKKIHVQWTEAPGNRRFLARLGPFIWLWRTIFFPFLPKTVSNARTEAPSSSGNTLHSDAAPEAESEKHRDIELLKSIVKFSDVTVKQVMQPRSKVVAVDFRTRFHELFQIVREAGFSRMPVYDEDLDNITGILYIKDLVSHIDKPDDFEWQSLIRTNVQLVPEAKRISELLQEFKRNKRHMAIVVDEYGGSSGIVTMEDILEEITGEIRDEFDEESEIRFRKIDDHNYLFEGQTLLNDVCRIAGLAPGAFDDIRGSADTIAGLALELRGDIPKPGTELDWNNYRFVIVAADERRIEQIKLTIKV